VRRQEIQDSGKSVSKLNLHNFKSSTAASKWHIDSRRGRNGNDVFDFDYANLSVGTMFAHRSGNAMGFSFGNQKR